MQPIERAIPYWLAGGFHRLAYTEWGDPDAEPVLCVHGLSRTGRDFDVLATALADRFHVICPDLPGRGLSSWLPQAELYQPASYVTALGHLLAVIGRRVRWVGTSLGGICGMVAAAAPGTPITRMVLNDIGPFVPAAALARIRDYIGELPHFANLAAAEAYLRRVHAPFGALSDAQWRQLTETSVRALPDGGLALHFDPALTEPILAAAPQDMDLWPIWARIEIPMMVLRGADSDLLLPDTLQQMAEKAVTHVVPHCGHAPALMDAPTIAVLRSFLEGKEGQGALPPGPPLRTSP